MNPMLGRALFLIVMMLLVAACAPRQSQELPTLVPWPTELTVEVASLASPTTVIIERTLPPTFTPTLTTTPYPTFTGVPPTTTPVTPSATPTITPTQPTATASPTAFAAVEEAFYADITQAEALTLLQETPLLTIPYAHIAQIYARGQGRGLASNFVLSVGDCNTENIFYLESLLDDSPPQGDMDFSYLDDADIQATIDYFGGAFAFKGESVDVGLNALSVMDPFWADPENCPAGESPLACDYRLTNPFASVIMFGANDIRVLSASGYELALREIIEQTLERDIIPVLSTFTIRQTGDGYYPTAVRFNAIIVRLAQEYDLPLMNFWLAARDLPANGILNDNAHLTVNGFNMRNRLTLDMLTRMRQALGLEIAST